MADELITVRGLEETLAALSRAPQAVAKAAFGKALAAAARPVAEAVEANTPEKTGDLRSHLVTDIALDAEGRGGSAQIGFGKEGWKARLVEYGHRMVGHKPNKKELGTVAAHPFMGPAAASTAEAALEKFEESLVESLDDGTVGLGARVA